MVFLTVKAEYQWFRRDDEFHISRHVCTPLPVSYKFFISLFIDKQRGLLKWKIRRGKCYFSLTKQYVKWFRLSFFQVVLYHSLFFLFLYLCHRDSRPEIRALCIQEIGLWMLLYRYVRNRQANVDKSRKAFCYQSLLICLGLKLVLARKQSC